VYRKISAVIIAGIEKVYRGIDLAEKDGEISQQDVEKRLGKRHAGQLGYPKRSRTLNRSPNAML